MTTPYVGFGNDTLATLPAVAVGDEITCPQCQGRHVLRGDDGGGTRLLFYRCGNVAYLGAVAGRLIIGVPPDASGSL